jgi:hypothetical protein
MIHADGDVTENEWRVGKQIMKLEGLADEILETEFAKCQLLSKTELMDLCIASLNRPTTKYQIRSLAWMYIVSEIDWAVDKAERFVIEPRFCSRTIQSDLVADLYFGHLRIIHHTIAFF